jgi:hypothetical protein
MAFRPEGDECGPRNPAQPMEGENESPERVEAEQVEVERGVPETENEPVERERPEETEAPIFEELINRQIGEMAPPARPLGARWDSIVNPDPSRWINYDERARSGQMAEQRFARPPSRESAGVMRMRSIYCRSVKTFKIVVSVHPFLSRQLQ